MFVKIGFLLLVVLTGVCADTVELKTGEKVDGGFKQATPSGVVIEVAGQPITIPLEKVQAIYFGSVKPSNPSVPAPSQEALDALKGLRSVTESGIPLRDYTTRVLDAKVKVDRYSSSQPNDSAELRKALVAAMHIYELASQSWSAAAVTSGQSLSVLQALVRAVDEDPDISKCPSVRQFVDQNRAQLKLQIKKEGYANQREGVLGQLLGSRPAVLWSCASAQVAEAERLVQR